MKLSLTVTVVVVVDVVSGCSVNGAGFGRIKSVGLDWGPRYGHELPWCRYKEAVQANNISGPSLPTPQARAGGSRQFEQVVVVDVAVVVVLVEVVVDLHLFHLLVRNWVPPVQLLQFWEQLVPHGPCCPGHWVG